MRPSAQGASALRPLRASCRRLRGRQRRTADAEMMADAPPSVTSLELESQRMILRARNGRDEVRIVTLVMPADRHHNCGLVLQIVPRVQGDSHFFAIEPPGLLISELCERVLQFDYAIIELPSTKVSEHRNLLALLPGLERRPNNLNQSHKLIATVGEFVLRVVIGIRGSHYDTYLRCGPDNSSDAMFRFPSPPSDRASDSPLSSHSTLGGRT